MGSLIYLVLIIVLIIMLMKNLKLAKRAKHTKKYIECSNAIFEGNDNALNMIDEYIANEESVEFQNKARVLKIYEQIRHQIDPTETIVSIDLYDTIYTKNKMDVEKFEYNSDTYFWLLLDLVKLHTSEYKNEVDTLRVIVDKYHEDIKTDIAVELFYDIDKTFKGIDDKGVIFYQKLLSGEYAGYSYDKRLIGFYKRVAASMLVYLNEAINEDDREDLKTFATMKAGKLIMTDLGIIDEFLVEEEVSDDQENSEEIIEETKETSEDSNEVALNDEDKSEEVVEASEEEVNQ